MAVLIFDLDASAFTQVTAPMTSMSTCAAVMTLSRIGCAVGAARGDAGTGCLRLGLRTDFGDETLLPEPTRTAGGSTLPSDDRPHH